MDSWRHSTVVVEFQSFLSRLAVFLPLVEATVCFDQTSQKKVLVNNFDNSKL